MSIPDIFKSSTKCSVTIDPGKNYAANREKGASHEQAMEIFDREVALAKHLDTGHTARARSANVWSTMRWVCFAVITGLSTCQFDPTNVPTAIRAVAEIGMVDGWQDAPSVPPVERTDTVMQVPRILAKAPKPPP